MANLKFAADKIKAYELESRRGYQNTHETCPGTVLLTPSLKSRKEGMKFDSSMSRF